VGCPLRITELYKRSIRGDSAARKQLYEQLYVSFRILARHRIADWNDADEVVQAAMVKVSSKLSQLANEEGFSAWAHKILKNEIIDHYRGAEVRRRRESGLDAGELSRDHVSGNGHLKRKLKDCLKKLNTAFGKHARILNLRYQGYGTEEICARMSITPNNLYVILSRARVMLKTCLESGEVRP